MQIGHHIASNYDSRLQDNSKLEATKSVENNNSISSKGDLSTLKEGSVFRAQILDILGDKVKIALDNKTELFAKLQDGVSLGIGDQLLFSVKENNTNQILIKPMFDSLYTAQMQVLEKVLDAANLSPTEKNFSAAKELMEAGLPVDKSNLVKVLSQSMKFEGTSMKTIVALNKMEIPVTKENIMQYERYQNYNHQLSGDIANTTDSIASFANNLPDNTSVSSMISMANQILDIFHKSTNTSDFRVRDHSSIINIQNPEALNEEKIVENNIKDSMELSNLEKEFVLKETNINAKNIINESVSLMENSKNSNFVNLEGIEERTLIDSASKFEVSNDNLKDLTNLLHKEGIKGEEIKYILQKSSQPEDVVKNILNTLSQIDKKPLIVKHILQSDEWKNFFSEVIKKHWTLNPKEMKDSKEIEELYNKILKQGTEFQDLMASKGGDSKEFNQNFQNMRQNMQFMEQVNHQMIYAQMPLKLSQQNTNSELYVYADKRKLMEKKDGISVMLHLDMDYLGMTDVKVTLTGSNVNARFYLNDQESVDIVSTHMNELAKQLSDRGFSLTNEVVKRQPQESINKVVDEVIDENAEKSIKRYTFDART